MLDPPVITTDELEGAQKIRRKIKGIPQEFDTDFYLARWWRAYQGDLQLIRTYMKQLFEHRRLLGYDRIDTEGLRTKLDMACKTFERFSISSFSPQFSGNVCVFVQKMEGTDLKEIMRVIPLCNVLHSYFILQEMLTRRMLEKEAETGKPSAAVIILDLKGLNISEFLNPLGVQARLARLVISIWSNYFTETLFKLFVINSPALLSVLWYIMKFIADKKTQSRIQILDDPSELLRLLNPQAVPEAYGGKWRDNSGYADPPGSVCRKPLKVLPHHTFDSNELWRKYGYENAPQPITVNLKSKSIFEINKICEKDDQFLLWQFTVNGDVEFEIIKKKRDGFRAAWPKITSTSLLAPEQGCIRCRRGHYIIRFQNPATTWTPTKIHYSIEFSK